MSADHVRRMNERLAASAAVRRACAALPRDVTLGWRLTDEDSGAVHGWQMHFSRRDGVRFALASDAPADARFSGGYWAMVANTIAQREGRPAPAPLPEVSGDAGAIDAVQPAFAAAHGAARIAVRMPERAARG